MNREPSLPTPLDLSALLDGLPDPLFTVDAGWRLTYLNCQAADLLGAAPAEVLGCVLWDCCPQGQDSALDAECRWVMATRQERQFGLADAARGGPAEVRAFPYRDGIAVQVCKLAACQPGEAGPEALLNVTRALASASSQPEAIRAALAFGQTALGAAGGALWQLGGDGTGLIQRDTLGELPPEGLANGVRPVTDALSRREEVFLSPSPGTPAGTLAAVAVGTGEEPWGVLTLIFGAGRTPDEATRETLRTLAAQLGQALERLQAAEAGAQALAALGRERARLSAILDQMPAAIWIAEVPGGRIIAGNGAIERILRAPSRLSASVDHYDEYLGFHPDGRPYQAHEWPLARTVLTGERVENEEIEMQRGDGTRGFVQYSSALVRDGGSGDPALAVVTGVDVTELRELRATLEQRVEGRTRELVQRNEDLAAETAALQVFANFTELVGRETDLAVLTQAATSVLHRALGDGSTGYYALDGDLWKQGPWDGDMEVGTLAAAQAGFPADLPLFAQPATSHEALFVDRWRSSGHLLAPHTPEYGAIAVYPVVVQGQTVGQLAAGLREKTRWSERDRAVFRAVGRALSLATERAESARTLATKQRQLEQANRDLEAFASSVSHDLRAPVRHMGSFAGLLRRAVPDNPRALKYVDVIEQSTARMNALIDSLLTFARLGTGEVQKADVALNELVDTVRAELAPELGERQIDWRVGPLPVVRGSAALLRQVFQNLLGNAVKYSRTRERAVIEVWAETSGHDHVIHVRDNGVGFDPAFRDKLFEVFGRLHSAQEFEGDGVGLASVERIVERHGGRVWAEGQPGEGATFSFTLPG
ncbi:ATP-binding protein [Deinococcus metallilatus]|uniref:histidine kinase n=1 Tax=Deinococcus metallilatus TaxID=1211322 RepID=A0ABR6MML4_9DEIO|nr:ATP-binding protein [Deinococcus metallilatus]MBB5293194.1 signal transduction histidine kinase/PAS domain-containing protein [Deinococcus metallilatus]